MFRVSILDLKCKTHLRISNNTFYSPIVIASAIFRNEKAKKKKFKPRFIDNDTFKVYHIVKTSWRRMFLSPFIAHILKLIFHQGVIFDTLFDFGDRLSTDANRVTSKKLLCVLPWGTGESWIVCLKGMQLNNLCNLSDHFWAHVIRIDAEQSSVCRCENFIARTMIMS